MITAASSPALTAYKNQLKLAQDAGQTVTASEQGGQSNSFSQLLETQLNDVINTQNSAEAIKVDAISGKADIADLVTAIANAELALNTIVTIRDKAIGAYQDIIRMPI